MNFIKDMHTQAIRRHWLPGLNVCMIFRLLSRSHGSSITTLVQTWSHTSAAVLEHGFRQSNSHFKHRSKESRLQLHYVHPVTSLLPLAGHWYSVNSINWLQSQLPCLCFMLEAQYNVAACVTAFVADHELHLYCDSLYLSLALFVCMVWAVEVLCIAGDPWPYWFDFIKIIISAIGSLSLFVKYCMGGKTYITLDAVVLLEY